jgi:signal transduction histidine kinase
VRADGLDPRREELRRMLDADAAELLLLDGPGARPTGLAGFVLDTGAPFSTDDDVTACARLGLAPGARAEARPWAGAPLTDGERVLGVAAVTRAARPFTEADERVLAGAARLAGRALAAARGERLRALATMASGVAHSLNNTLAAILIRAEILTMETLDEAHRRHVDVIHAVAEEGARTLRRIQALGRLRRARPFEAVALDAVVAPVLAATRAGEEAPRLPGRRSRAPARGAARAPRAPLRRAGGGRGR